MNNFNYYEYEFESGMGSWEERLEFARQLGKESKGKFYKKFDGIDKWFSSYYDSLYILSYCMRYFSMSVNGEDEEVTKGRSSFAPHLQEILQALSLTHERQIEARPLLGYAELLRREMIEISDLFQYKMFDLPDSIKTKEDFSSYRIRTEVMSYNMVVRNWAYYTQMKEITEDMAKAIQADFIKVHNACPLAFVQLLFLLCSKMEERVNKHLKKTRVFFSKRDYISVQREYERQFKIPKSDKKRKRRMWNYSGKNLKRLKMMLLAHSDLRLSDLFTFSIEDLYELCEGKLSKESLINLFDKISYEFGDLKKLNKEFIVLDNPVQSKPFIKIESGEYFSSIWTSIPHLTLSLLENITQENKDLSDKYFSCRSKYLEDKIEDLCRKSFPGAQIFKGSKWDAGDGKTIYENDLTVIVGSFALVIEAKSGNFSRIAKRGATNTLFKTIKELVEEPSQQALRFINQLKSKKGEFHFNTDSGKVNIIDTSKITYFIPIGVTFYHLGTISSNLKLLIKGGLTDLKLDELAPSMSLTDLQIVLDTLASDATKIHYLQRRRELEHQVDYIGDELDLLGFYTDTAFNIGDKENSEGYVMNISLMSKIFDPYYIPYPHERHDINKVKLKITPWFETMLDRLSKRRIEQWLEVSYILLHMRIDEQVELENRLHELIQKIRDNEVTEKHNWVAFITAIHERQFSIVAYPYNISTEERNSMFNEIVTQELERNSKMKGVVILGINIDNINYPYNVIAAHLSELIFDDSFLSMSNSQRIS